MESDSIVLALASTCEHAEMTDGKVAPCLMARAGTGGNQLPIVLIRRQCMHNGKKYVLRRLTPLECARLQGFPDWWTDGVEGSDTSKYKMWGNGVSLPCVFDILKRITREIENTH